VKVFLICRRQLLHYSGKQKYALFSSRSCHSHFFLNSFFFPCVKSFQEGSSKKTVFHCLHNLHSALITTSIICIIKNWLHTLGPADSMQDFLFKTYVLRNRFNFSTLTWCNFFRRRSLIFKIVIRLYYKVYK
jgi:hypothetical protein